MKLILNQGFVSASPYTLGSGMIPYYELLNLVKAASTEAFS